MGIDDRDEGCASETPDSDSAGCPVDYRFLRRMFYLGDKSAVMAYLIRKGRVEAPSPDNFISRILRDDRARVFRSIFSVDDSLGEEYLDRSDIAYQQHLARISESFAGGDCDMDTIVEVIVDGEVPLELRGACVEFLWDKVFPILSGEEDGEDRFVDVFLGIATNLELPPPIRHLAKECLDGARGTIKNLKVLKRIDGGESL